uniref:Single-stranded DNA binding protein n=1 Tax=Acrosorium ciliolatum TaxID=1550622 RepID=A0A1Z1M2H0_9FLOR|nr:hypothetical protein [Acrosorium ciliolatum]ARW59984.1 hypothetical protein [Acrosorium ciliolatum]
MNNFIITAQIVSHPKIIRSKSENLIIMLITIPNNKKKLCFFNCRVYIKRNVLNKFKNFYRKEDLCLIAGNIKINNSINKENNLFNKYKFKKYLSIDAYIIQPYIYN